MRWLPRLVEMAFYAVILFGGGLLVSWYVEGEPRETLVRYVETPRVEPGGDLRIVVRDRIARHCAVTINRWIIDSAKVVHPLAPQAGHRSVGIDVRTITNTVPVAAAPGEAIYRVRLDWRCNPLQRVWPRTIALPDLTFTIVESRKESRLWPR